MSDYDTNILTWSEQQAALRLLVGVHAGAEKCDDRPDGSRLCWIPVFERLPTSVAK